jgi:anti-sigma regulatory factor (Ser/Thr protein kinase)
VARALSADAITLSIPHAKPYHGVARLVVGGLAARLNLSYEHLEDLQLALASVLERDGYVVGEEVTVRLEVEQDAVAMTIGPLDPDELQLDLGRPPGDGISLARLLATLVEEVELEEVDGEHRLRLEKRVSMTRPEPREPV